jgi:hypothetical protein
MTLSMVSVFARLGNDPWPDCQSRKRLKVWRDHRQHANQRLVCHKRGRTVRSGEACSRFLSNRAGGLARHQ